ncbi:hypothetical protein SISNIDRAFT_492131 [Sistotremastrum niveocremeum HHB9708]|uniref:Uncharacterized protein n=1 Tax=Sistotremastrum niveocremeum HHB9708 TaxID=1314777 RepID=A0A164M1U5_9AGAM|nr:hypothetical protein SISNIDRAFT_492131 [Sistotremastrum niveocremeum HHB9708]
MQTAADNIAAVLDSDVDAQDQMPVDVTTNSRIITAMHRHPTIEIPPLQAAHSSDVRAYSVRITHPPAGRNAAASASDVTGETSRPPTSIASGSRGASLTVYSNSADKNTARLESPEIPYHHWKPVPSSQSPSRSPTPAGTHALISSLPLFSEIHGPWPLSSEFFAPPSPRANQNADRHTIRCDVQENSDVEGRDIGISIESEVSNTPPVMGSKRKRGMRGSSNIENEERAAKLPPLTPLVWKAVHKEMRTARQEIIKKRLNFNPRLPAMVSNPPGEVKITF